MTGPLRESLKEHFQQFRLSERQLADLDDLQREPLFRTPRAVLRIAGIAFVLLSLAILGTWYLAKNPSPSSELARLSEEIAYNHNKHMRPEFETHSISDLQVSLSKLDFSLIESAQLLPENWELMGGRYCNLQGHLAAQIKLRNQAHNNEYTLYQLAVPNSLKESDGTYDGYHLGVRVRMWKERGVLLGIAGKD